MKVSAQELRLHDARTHELGFLAAALGAFAIAAAICNGATPTQETTEPIWPTKEWQMSSPEMEGMDSKELAKLVDFGTVHSFDSLLVARHGKVVAEAYYAPYSAGIPHAINSCTKAVISTLTAIAFKEGLLDKPSHRVLDFFDRQSIANVGIRAGRTINTLQFCNFADFRKRPSNQIPSLRALDIILFNSASSRARCA